VLAWCEAALAHVIESKAEAAYRRDLFEKGRKLMEAWAADYATPGRPARWLHFGDSSKCKSRPRHRSIANFPPAGAVR
jgi:hypothetical protein